MERTIVSILPKGDKLAIMAVKGKHKLHEIVKSNHIVFRLLKVSFKIWWRFLTKRS